MERFAKGFIVLFGGVLSWSVVAATAVPPAFDLRNVQGQNYVTPVKSQSGGTCWTHGTMAAIESNLLVTGAWKANGETGVPLLAEYHLDWWNGFNEHFNADIAPQSGGLQVHEGGDYRVATAYLARAGGAVRKIDGQSFDSAPLEKADSYHVYYVRDVEWVASSENGSTQIKEALLNGGAIGTALSWSDQYYSDSKNAFYQPASSSDDPNHSVAIVGWDDAKQTQASKPGAWLAKNSWGTSWADHGFFWISYYDKTSGHHADMGAVSFRNAEPLRYQQIYSLDYHGWRDTKKDASEVFNAFVAKGGAAGKAETLSSVSFYTAADNVHYTVKVYAKFDGGELQDQVSQLEGDLVHTGFHTLDLAEPVSLHAGDHFYIYLSLSAGGQPFDRTSDVPVLLGARYRTTVESVAHPGESYYRSGSHWVDLNGDDKSANFCVKGLSIFQ